MKTCLYILILLFGFISCKRNDPPAGPQTKLKRVIESFPNRQAWVTSYEYDAEGRVIQLKNENHDSTITPLKIISTWHQFYYAGNSPDPVRDIITYGPGSGRSPDTVLHLYDASNKIIRTDRFNSGNLLRDSFIYRDTMIVIEKRGNSVANPALIERDTVIFDLAGRASKIFSSSRPDTLSYKSFSFDYKYDGKKNPFADINIYKALNTLDNFDFLFPMKAPNNLVSNWFVWSALGRLYIDGGGTKVETNYEYNSHDYPVKGKIVRTSYSPLHTTIRFEYY